MRKGGRAAKIEVNSHRQALKVEWEGVTRACMSTLKIMLGGDGTGASHGVQTWEGNTEKGRGKTGNILKKCGGL